MSTFQAALYFRTDANNAKATKPGQSKEEFTLGTLRNADAFLARMQNDINDSRRHRLGFAELSSLAQEFSI